MSFLTDIARFISRFRHPVSLPEDVANDIGVSVSNNLTFNEFLDFLTSFHCRPTKLRKYMPREEAEAAFISALKKENFNSNTLFSYYFSKGWLVFALYYDREGRLRRLNVQCPCDARVSSYDLQLDQEHFLAKVSSI
jgi:hypothetical protein